MNEREWIPLKDQLYYFNTTSWKGHVGASISCQNTGGHLAIINSKETETFFNDYIDKYQLEPMIPCLWIGLRNNGKKWIWPGNSDLSYKNWHETEPNTVETEQCVNKRIRSPYSVDKPWFNDYCDPAGPTCGFICQKANQVDQSATSTTGMSLIPIFIPILICIAVIVIMLLILYCRKTKHRSKTTSALPNNHVMIGTLHDSNAKELDIEMSSITTNNDLLQQHDTESQHPYYESIEENGDLLIIRRDHTPMKNYHDSDYQTSSHSMQAEDESEKAYDILDLESSPARNRMTRA